MVFPATPLPLGVELFLGGAWVDVTAEPVYRRSMLNISRGSSDESSQTEPSSCNFQLNNRDGKFSPRNPTSPYYGQLGRNTPVRAWVNRGTPYLALNGIDADYISTPDSVATSITSDIDVRIEIQRHEWSSGVGVDLIGKWVDTGNQRSWAFYLDAGGFPELWWSANGTATLSQQANAKAPPPRNGRMALRVVMDVNDGASNRVHKFYWAPTITGPWEQIGSTIVTSGTTSIFNSTAPTTIGKIPSFSFAALNGRVLRADVKSGIGGTTVANPDFTIQTVGATSFADSSGNTWTRQGGAAISNRQYRFHGEVAAWPQRWDATGTDVYVPVEAAGILRRIAQGSNLDGSVLYRGILRDADSLVAYWPLEDAQGSQYAAAGLDTHDAMSFTGVPEFESFSDFVASNSIVTLKNAAFTGGVPRYTTTNFAQVRFLMNIPAAGTTSGQTILLFYTTGSVRRWEVHYDTGGTLGLRAFDGNGTSLFDTGDVAFDANGDLLYVSVELTQSGANIGYNLLTLQQGQSVGAQFPGTLNSNTFGRVGAITLSPNGGLADVSVGHLTVQSAITSLFDLSDQLNAWTGERAGTRFIRLCTEESIPYRTLGDTTDTARMGYQRPNALSTLFAECAIADGGLLFEPREAFALGYRTRTSLYNQPVAVELAYDEQHLAHSLDPTDDDQRTHNDRTVTRERGSTARAVLDTGSLSILPPPNGVGRYDDSTTINVQNDQDLPDQANWRLRLGTVDEARYPVVSVDMSRHQINDDSALVDALHLLNVGDRLTILNPPAWMPPEDVSQVVWGYVESLGNFEEEYTLNCSPESVYHVAEYGNGNLAENASFETNTTGWAAITNGSIARVTTQAYTGIASMTVTRTVTNPPFNLYGADHTGLDPAIPEGTVVTISCYLRIPSASLPHFSGLLLSNNGAGIHGFASLPTGEVATADTWQRWSITGGIELGPMTQIGVQIWTDNGHTNGQIVAYVDAVNVRSVPTEDLVDRYQPIDATLNEDLTTTETDVDVATATLPLWTIDPNEFPFDIMVGGERMTVTSISGSSSPQTFTVIRSRNGIVKAHSTGAAVALFRQSVYAL